ncbi:hypothetical protein SEA_BUNKER_20 [Gordonia phage Bunker]|nr:hypothetical protein SEA_BUNKER_20 [Gordonia phage Bunker]
MSGGQMIEDGSAAAKVAATEHANHIAQIAAVTGETVEYLAEQVALLVATFVGLPGVTGAPMIMGPDYYTEVAIHQLELGVRVPAEPIKKFIPPEGLRGSGSYEYLDSATAPTTPQERYARMRAAEFREFKAEVQRRREEAAANGGGKKPRSRKK